MGSMLPYTAYMDPMGMCVCLCSAQQNPGCIPAGRDCRDLLEHLRRLVSQWHPVLMSLNLPISGPQTRQSLKRWRQNGAGGGPRWRSKWRRPDVNVAEGGQTDSRPADPREILQHSHHVVSCLWAHFLFVQEFRLCLMDICSSTKSSAVSCAKHLYAHYWLHPLDRLW